MRLRGIAVGLLVVLAAVSAWAQKPLAVSTAELDQHVVRRVKVEYPAAAKAAHESGTVLLLVELNAAGKVDRVLPVSGPAVLQAAAAKSVEQWKFRPFEKDGHKVAANGLLRVTFHAGGPATPVEKFLTRVRSKYATEPRLIQEGFACHVEPAWQEFPQVKYQGADSPMLERLRRTKVRLVVSSGGNPLTEVDKARKPKLGVKELAEVDQLVKTTRQMLRGFYETWLPFGILGPNAPENASMKTGPVKQRGTETVIVYKQGGTTDWMSFDAESRMLHFTQLMPGSAAVEETPQFEATPDGLLYTGTNFDNHRPSSGGQPDMHGSYRVQYQKVDGFRLPKTVEVEVNGTLDVHFQFSECTVGG